MEQFLLSNILNSDVSHPNKNTNTNQFQQNSKVIISNKTMLILSIIAVIVITFEFCDDCYIDRMGDIIEWSSKQKN